MRTETTVELDALIREWEAELGPDVLAQARYQERMRVVRFLLGLVMPLVLVVVWLPTGWAVALRERFLGNTSWWGTWTVLLVILLSEAVLALPFSWYFDFHLENRLGLNRQSLGGWLLDELKQAMLAIPLQSLLFLALYAVLRLLPPRWLLPGFAGVVAGFLVVFYLLQPVFLRLKFKTEPLDDPDLEARIRRLFEKAGVPFAGLSVLKAGEKTARSNAALVPRGVGTEVVLFDTLLEAMTPEAIEDVVAHELGHKVHRRGVRRAPLGRHLGWPARTPGRGRVPPADGRAGLGGRGFPGGAQRVHAPGGTRGRRVRGAPDGQPRGL